MAGHSVIRVVVIGLLGVAGMSFGCSDSSSSPMQTPTPVPPPPAPVVPTVFTVRLMSPTSGPTLGGDYIRVIGTGFRSGVTVSIDGVFVPVTRVTDTTVDARTVAHAALGAADVAVMNPDGQTVTLTGGYTFAEFFVSGGPSLVAPGGELTVSWVMPPGRTCNGGGDWVALYRIGDPDNTGSANGHSDIWYDHLCGAVSGTFKLKAPTQTGAYEFRLLTGDYSVARSGTITVSETIFAP